jgi:hypothetical protein
VLVPSSSCFHSYPPRAPWASDGAPRDASIKLAEVAIELVQTLVSLQNLAKLIINWQSDSGKPGPALGQVMQASWPALAPRLVSLDVRGFSTTVEDVALFSPCTMNLRQLVLGISGWHHRGPISGLSKVAESLIAPAHHSLTLLKLEFIIWADPPQLTTVYDTLAALTFPNLRHLGVISPFRTAAPGSEEDPLVSFLCHHTALRTLCMVPTPGPNGRIRTGLDFIRGSGYTRFIRLAIGSLDWRASQIRSVALSLPSNEAVSTDMVGALAQLCEPLQELWLDCQDVSADRIIGVGQEIASKLPCLGTLHIQMTAVTPSILNMLTQSFAGLRALHVRIYKSHSFAGPMPTDYALERDAATEACVMADAGGMGLQSIEDYLRKAIPGLESVSVSWSGSQDCDAFKIMPAC